MSFVFTNNANVAVNIAVTNGGVIWFHKNRLRSGETWSTNTADVWYDVTVFWSQGPINDIDPSKHNAQQIIGLTLAGVGGAAAIAAIFVTAGAATPIVITAVGLAAGAGGVLFSVVAAALNRAQVEALFGPDGYDISITGGADVANAVRVNDVVEYPMLPPTLHWSNKKTGSEGMTVVSEKLGSESWITMGDMAVAEGIIYALHKGVLYSVGTDGSRIARKRMAFTGAMTSMGDSVYFFWDGQLWRRTNGGDVSSIGSGWIFPGAIASMGGNLYAFQDSKLWRVTSSGKSTNLGGGWTATGPMAGLGDRVYAFQGGKLWKVDRNGKFEDLGGGWGGTLHMTALGDHLYVVQDDVLWQVDKEGNKVHLGERWTGTGAMAGLGDSLYVAQGGNLWRVMVEITNPGPIQITQAQLDILTAPEVDDETAGMVVNAPPTTTTSTKTEWERPVLHVMMN